MAIVDHQQLKRLKQNLLLVCLMFKRSTITDYFHTIINGDNLKYGSNKQTTNITNPITTPIKSTYRQAVIRSHVIMYLVGDAADIIACNNALDSGGAAQVD